MQVADLKEEFRSPVDDIILGAGYRARLVAPLFRGDEIVGMLVVRRRAPGTFPQNAVDLMKTFAAQSGGDESITPGCMKVSRPAPANWRIRCKICAPRRTGWFRRRSSPRSVS